MISATRQRTAAVKIVQTGTGSNGAEEAIVECSALAAGSVPVVVGVVTVDDESEVAMGIGTESFITPRIERARWPDDAELVAG